MQFLAMFAFICVASIVLQSVVKILVLLALLSFAWAFVSKPAEVSASLIGLMCFGLLARYPLIGIPVIVGLAILGAIR